MNPLDEGHPLSQTPARAGVFLSRYAPTEENLERLAQVLRSGELVAVPSETVYGLAADATNPDACRKIFALKRRPFFDPLIVHVQDVEQARKYAQWNPIADDLARAFWPGPLTLVLPRSALIPDVVTSGGPTVAIRAPGHPLFQKLLHRVGRGLAAPSANPFGYISPTTAEHVESSFGRELPYILDGGPCEVGVESTIVDVCNPGRLRILRHGGIPADDLQSFVAGLSIQPKPALEHVIKSAEAQDSQPAIAPGLLKRHYSPHTPLRLYPYGRLPDPRDHPDVAHLFFQQPSVGGSNVFALTVGGDSREAAAQLYALLRQLDSQGWTEICAELPPDGTPFSIALIDRLERAAAR